jgi:ketosteroid isomerase-like protein
LISGPLTSLRRESGPNGDQINVELVGRGARNTLCKKLMGANIEAVEARLRKLADIEGIKMLKARYAEACDNHYDADAIAELFTEDATWDGGKFGKAEGRENIRRFFRRAPEIFSFAIHHVMNPRIEVDGDHATGQWYLMQPATREPGNQAVWLAAAYNDEYVRVGGKWHFKRLKVNSNFLTTYEEGWAKKRFV